MQKYSCGFAFEGNKVALIVKNRPEFMKGKMNGIGGHVEEGESFAECMAREFWEETGYRTSVDRWIPFAEVKGTKSHIMFYHAYLSTMEDKLTTVTDEQIVVVPVNTVNEFNALYNVPWLLRMAQSHLLDRRVSLYQIQEIYGS